MESEDIFKKGIESKIFITIFSSSRYWFSDRFVHHICKFCNGNNIRSIVSFEQTSDLISKYLTPKRCNSLNNIQFYQLVKAVQIVWMIWKKKKTNIRL